MGYSFPLQKIIERHINKYWITAGIKISCNHRREFYLLSGDSNDTNLKNYYKQYCRILTNVIREAKKSMYQNQIINSNSKIKTTWNIIKSVSDKMNIN